MPGYGHGLPLLWRRRLPRYLDQDDAVEGAEEEAKVGREEELVEEGSEDGFPRVRQLYIPAGRAAGATAS